MTHQQENDMVEQTNAIGPQPTARARRGRGALFLILGLIVGAVGGGVITTAFGQAPGLMYMHSFAGGSFDPAQRVERAIKHLAVEADATPDQQAKLVAIAKGAVNDLLPMRERLQANRRQALDLFTAGNVDRAAIERLRTEQMAMAETA